MTNYVTIKTFWAFILCITCACGVSAQSRKNDNIVKRDSSVIEAVIITVTDQTIQYKKVSDPLGPVFHILKSDVAKVLYGNGETETFKRQKTAPVNSGNVIVYPMSPWTQPGFTDDMKPWRSEDLKSAHTFFNSKARAAKTSAIVAASVGGAAAIAGIILVRKAKRYNNDYGYHYEDYDQKQLGTGLIVGGLVTGTVVGTIGLIKGTMYRRKAKLVNEELVKRKEPLALISIQPTVDFARKNASLSFSLSF